MNSEDYSPGKISQFLNKGSSACEEKEEISKLFNVTQKTKTKRKNQDEVNKREAVESSIDDLEAKKSTRPIKFASNAEKRIYLQEHKQSRKEQNKKTVFVGNVSVTATKKELCNLFKSCGKIESIRLRSAPVNSLKLPKKVSVIKKEFHEKRNNLNAYIVFANEESVDEALKISNTEFKDLHLRVDRAVQNKQHLHKSSIFIGNLPYDAEEEGIRGAFSICGDIGNIRIVRDSKTGCGKGFGYVTFEDSSSVDIALSLNGQKLLGRELRIQRSSQKIKKAASTAEKVTSKKWTKKKTVRQKENVNVKSRKDEKTPIKKKKLKVKSKGDSKSSVRKTSKHKEKRGI